MEPHYPHVEESGLRQLAIALEALVSASGGRDTVPAARRAVEVLEKLGEDGRGWFRLGFAPPLLQCNDTSLGMEIADAVIVACVGPWFHQRGIPEIVVGVDTEAAELVELARWLAGLQPGDRALDLLSIPHFDCLYLGSARPSEDDDELTELGVPEGMRIGAPEGPAEIGPFTGEMLAAHDDDPPPPDDPPDDLVDTSAEALDGPSTTLDDPDDLMGEAVQRGEFLAAASSTLFQPMPRFPEVPSEPPASVLDLSGDELKGVEDDDGFHDLNTLDPSVPLHMADWSLTGDDDGPALPGTSLDEVLAPRTNSPATTSGSSRPDYRQDEGPTRRAPGLASAPVLAYAQGTESERLKIEDIVHYLLDQHSPDKALSPDEALLQRLAGDARRLPVVLDALGKQAMSSPDEADAVRILGSLSSLMPRVLVGPQRHHAVRTLDTIARCAGPRAPAALRQAAESRLEELATPRTTRRLVTWLSSEHPKARRDGRHMLTLLGRWIVPVLVDELERAGDNNLLRGGVVDVLGEVGRQARARKQDPARFLDPLLKVIKQPDEAPPNLLFDALQALANAGAPSFERYFLNLLDARPDPTLMPAMVLGLRHGASDAARKTVRQLLGAGSIPAPRPYGAAIPYLYNHDAAGTVELVRRLLKKKGLTVPVLEASLHGLAIARYPELDALLANILESRGLTKRPSYPDAARLAALELAAVRVDASVRKRLLELGAQDPAELCQRRSRALLRLNPKRAAEQARGRLGFQVTPR